MEIFFSIITSVPEGHKKTLEEFEKFTNSGEIDKTLLEIYREEVIKAEELLGIFKIEKKKRGEFTYQRIAQANLEPANKSLENAKTFLKHIRKLCE